RNRWRPPRPAAPPRAGRPAWRSPAPLASHPLAKTREIRFVSRRPRRRCDSREQERPQPQTILISSDEIPDIFAARAIVAPSHLLVDEVAERLRQRDVHRGHSLIVSELAKIG